MGDTVVVDVETGEIVGSRSLDELEAVIDAGLSTFIEVGEALLTIRQHRLYKNSHKNFGDYCKDRWGFTRHRAAHLIAAAEVVTTVTTSELPAPVNESQTRPLAPLRDDPDTLTAAWQDAVESSGGQPTGEDVQAAVERAKREAAQKAEDNAAVRELNEKLQPPDFDPAENERLVAQRGEFSRLCKDIANLPSAVNFLADHERDLRRRHIDQAKRAHAWLTNFLMQVGEDPYKVEDPLP